jgi:HSP20 family molecular chaperone IbpA
MPPGVPGPLRETTDSTRTHARMTRPIGDFKEKETHSARRERRYGSFSRSTTLPPGIDAKRIKANTRDGVVKVTISLTKKAKQEPVQITPTAA